MNISLCMIVKNEEDVLARCLNSIKDVVDEIIIVDTGSDDKTKEIAKQFTDKVYDFVWCDDFGKARNFAFSFATKEYILWLDADDVLPKESIDKFIEIKKTLTRDISAVYMQYDIAFDQNGNTTFSYYRERLVRCDSNPVWVEPIHEVLTFDGKSILSDIRIEHRKTRENPKKRNLKIFNKMIKTKQVMSPRLKYYYARELRYNGFYKKAIKVFEDFLKEKNAWVENKIEACRELSFCYKMIKENDKALLTLFRSFCYALPRAETLCKIADCYKEKSDYLSAKYYYELALNCNLDNAGLGFVEKDYYNFIPYIELCFIYYKLGNINLAKQYNEMAGNIKPENPSYEYNKNFFEQLK